jgi:hypothetical protein
MNTTNDLQMQIVQQYIPLVPPGALGHYDISVITSVSAFPLLCGLTFDEFVKSKLPKSAERICTKSYSLLLKTHETFSLSIPM